MTQRMNVLNLVYFSPTGTTQKIVKTIGEHIGISEICNYDLTPSQVSDLNIKIDTGSLTIFGFPVYSGRLPLFAINKLKNIHSNNTPAILVVVYGNRDFDDALLELKELTLKCGFNIIAAAAFIGEHSFSTKKMPIAANRPDKSDLQQCKHFSKDILEKLHTFEDKQYIEDVFIPGNIPHKERKSLPPISPETNTETCNECKICENVCPTNAIHFDKGIITNKALCIWCCACIKACPQNSRYFNNSTIDGITEKLFLGCKERKEPVFFL
jgi:ferredoxin